MAEERTYIIPLREYWRMAPRYKRSKRAINGLRKFVIRHMKVKEVKIGSELNEAILSRGQRKPPARVHVTIVKDNDIGKVNLVGIPYSKEISLEKTSEKNKEKKPRKEIGKKETIKEEAKVEAKEVKHEHKEEAKVEKTAEKEEKKTEVKEKKPKKKAVRKKKKASE